ncbi:hypothetical protein BaRGS_00023563, partial [Batillaria attramentaria]
WVTDVHKPVNDDNAGRTSSSANTVFVTASASQTSLPDSLLPGPQHGLVLIHTQPQDHISFPSRASENPCNGELDRKDSLDQSLGPPPRGNVFGMVVNLLDAAITKAAHQLKLYAFIELYRQHECIWNVQDPKYHDRNVAREAYIDIARAMNMTEDEVKKKVRSLRTQYVQKLNQYTSQIKSGAAADDVQLPTWKFFQPLHFLKPFVILKNGRDNLVSFILFCYAAQTILVVLTEQFHFQ